MNATKAKQILEDVPRDDFITGAFTNHEDKCCAIGHLCRLTSDNPEDYSAGNCADFGILMEIRPGIKKFVRDKANEFLRGLLGNDFESFQEDSGFTMELDSVALSEVNNYDHLNGYTEDHPKDRVLHLLEDMIEAGY